MPSYRTPKHRTNVCCGNCRRCLFNLIVVVLLICVMPVSAVLLGYFKM